MAGRATGRLIRGLGKGGGTTLPGLVAQHLDGRAASKLAARLPHGVALTTGTNGKTTTARLLSAIGRHAGWRVLHNRAGANLSAGVLAALLEVSGDGRGPRDEVGVFEVDEAAYPQVQALLAPRAVVFTNLFRDQLDRYGEVDTVLALWRRAVGALPPDGTLVLNADDPLVAALSSARRDGPIITYGLDVAGEAAVAAPHASDARRCPHCGARLQHDRVYYGHVGVYRCAGCAFARPTPDVRATALVRRADGSQVVTIVSPQGCVEVTLRLPGLYNVYNALAAAAGALALGLELPAVAAGLSGAAHVFGRGESVRVEGRELLLALIKNPVGCTEVLRTVRQDAHDLTVLVIINDLLADGTDVSWLWDAEFELLAGAATHCVVAGTRAEDMAVRLKYAGIASQSIVCQPEIDRALSAALATVPPGGRLHVLPTYTALLAFRELLARRGVTHHFWED